MPPPMLRVPSLSETDDRHSKRRAKRTSSRRKGRSRDEIRDSRLHLAKHVDNLQSANKGGIVALSARPRVSTETFANSCESAHLASDACFDGWKCAKPARVCRKAA